MKKRMVKGELGGARWTHDEEDRLIKLATALEEAFGFVYVDTVHQAFQYTRTRRAIKERLTMNGFTLQEREVEGYKEVKEVRCTHYPDENPILHKNGVMVNYMKNPEMIRVVK